MKVIFLQDVANLARKNEIKEVKNGHARNFLIPNKLARKVTIKDLENLEGIKKAEAEKVEQGLADKKIMAEKMEGKEFVLKFKVGDEGQLFESVTVAKIAQAIQEKGFEIKENQIDLSDPIKSTGEFPVNIDLGDNLKAKVIIIITKL